MLIAGFGGLMLLLVGAGLDALLILQNVRASDAQVRDVYFRRSRALDEVRSGIYQSAIVMRDYLLAADRSIAQAQVENWTEIRQSTDRALADCAATLDPAEQAAFRDLENEVQVYWKLLDFISELGANEKQKSGAAYFSGELVRRRAAMLKLADRLDQISARELTADDAKLNAAFHKLRARLIWMLGLTAGSGLLLAAFTIRRTLELENELNRRSAEVRRHVESIKKLAEASVQVIRNMTLLLRPSMLDDFGLVPALEWQAREISKRTGLRVHVTAEETAAELPDTLRTCIYRVVQEALHNCARHSHARTVKVVV